MRNKLSVKSLLEEFPIPEKKDWEKVAQQETANTSIAGEKKFRPSSSLTFFPFYDHTDTAQDTWLDRFRLPASKDELGHGTRSWVNQPRINVSDTRTANLAALHHLQQGADGVLLKCTAMVDPQILFDGIQLPICHITMEFEDEPETDFVRSLIRYCQDQYANKAISIRLITPSVADQMGGLPDTMSLRLEWGVKSHLENDPVQEIATVLASGVSHVYALMDKGLSPADILPKMFFFIEGNEDFFVTYAKCKTLRMLWYQVVQALKCEMRYDEIFVHVWCAPWREKTYEPHATMLSHTIGAIAAICGGCDALTLIPEEEGNEMQQRVARNVSTILREESYLHVVADPLAGAYFPDQLVTQLARDAWRLFTEKQV